MEILCSVLHFFKGWILGPLWWFYKTITEIIKLQKVYTFVKWLVKRFSKKQDPPKEPHQDELSAAQLPQAPRKKTYVKTVGKDTPDYTPRVSATGLRADNASDVREALRGVDTLETVGLQRGSAKIVETTGIDLRSRQTRPGEGKQSRGTNISGSKTSFTVTGIRQGSAQNVSAVGMRF